MGEMSTDIPDLLLLYDGVCGLCNRLVQWVIAHDPAGRVRFAPLQSDVGQRLLREHGMRTDDFDTAVLIHRGQALTRARAVLTVMSVLRRPWSWLSPLARLPRPLLDFGYDRVARNRYRFFGRTEACMLPPPELRSRFLA
jgi:predicted DCC family thiol-disulfide oxidoreductase YuxK